MEEKLQFAVMIDAENVSSRYAPVIFDELEKYGFASCRRIYGNWSKENGWKEDVLLEYSVIPIQQFSYTSGKNSTDMAMVIDAMDLLYQNKVDGFCLVTSDSDFTRLAMRLREEKKYVLGMGESKTPLALTRACNKFVHLNLIGEANKDTASHAAQTRQDDAGMDNVTGIDNLENAIWTMLNESAEEELDLGFVGQRLSVKFPDFDVRNYGYSKLSVFLTEEMPLLRVHRENNHYSIGKSEEIPREKVEKEIFHIIRRNGGGVDNLAMINEELKNRFNGFDLKDYGYSRISGFLRSIQGLSVDGNVVRLKNKQ
ncbi:MAG: NYN domain-containing protein [Clostridiales bacterium]|nr:NYN domain-containing protein [Clostridiales bacterium]